MRKGLLGLAIVLSVAADCCDPAHPRKVEENKEQTRLIKLCEERGGIPIVDTIYDEGGHMFKKLSRCDFPPQKGTGQ